MNRKEKLLDKVRLEGNGLELGPLCWPVLTKGEASIEYVDHTTTKEIKRIYKDDPSVPPDQIVGIDYPLKGRSLKATVGNKKFDYIIASHVIEHVPDMIAWLNDMAAVLKTGGIVSLAIPDKNYTFDIDRWPSTPGDVIGAHLDEYKRFSSASMFDFASKYRQKVEAGRVWSGDFFANRLNAPQRYSLKEAYTMCNENKHQFVDCHCFVFTPYSFVDILRVLIELKLTDFAVASFFPTAAGEYEFLVSLQKCPKNMSTAERLKTLPKLQADSPLALTQTLYRQEQRIAELEQTLNHAQDELQHVLTSKSWQVTKPLRVGMRGAKRLKR